MSAIHRPRLHRHPRGHSGHGRVSAVVLPLLLHDDQPGALLNLQAGVDKASNTSIDCIYCIYSVYSGVQTFMAFMLDEKPEWTQHRLKILIGSSAVYFLLALPMCSKVAHKLQNIQS